MKWTIPGAALNIANAWTADQTLNDNVILGFGTDKDVVALLRASALAANTALAGVIVGTPVVPAIPANSAIIANVTADGDLVFIVQTGGNSWEGFRLDGSASEVVFSKDIKLGANKLIGVTAYLTQDAADKWSVRKVSDGDFASLEAQNVTVDGTLLLNGQALDAYNGDAGYVLIRARDTGVGLVEIARLVGAADPYFQATLAFRLLPIATASLPGTPVEGMLVYDDTANKLKVYNGTAWETVTSA